MTHDEAVAALEDMPDVVSVQKVGLQPGDVIVLRSPVFLGRETIHQMTQIMKSVWPDHRVVVLDAGLTLEVVRTDAMGEAPR